MAASVIKGNAPSLFAALGLLVALNLTMGSNDNAWASQTPVSSPYQIIAGGPPLQVLWGDVDCLGTVDNGDTLGILKFRAALPVLQGEPCPDIGASVQPGLWGDVDCDGDIDAIDGLKLLRYAAALPVSQNEPCPDIGTLVTVL
jgi:hypothetical protein